MNQVILDKPNVDLYGHIKYPNCFRWTRIILFQFISTILLQYGIMCSQYQAPPYPKKADYTPTLNPAHSAFQSLALFLVMSFAGQLTGGHCNPAITTSLLISKGNKITLIIALVYIFSQFAGAIAGGAIVLGLIDDFTCPIPASVNQTNVQAFGGEIMGTFLVCLFLLIIVHDTTTFLRSNFWNYILVPVVFYISREVTSQIDGLNPATVLSMQIFYGIRYGDWGPINNYWVYIVGPLIGSVASGIFFNYFFLPLFIRWKAKK